MILTGRWQQLIQWVGIVAFTVSSVPAAELAAGLRIGAGALLPGGYSSLARGLRGGVAWPSGFELGGILEKATYSNNINNLAVRGELCIGPGHSERRWTLGLTGGVSHFYAEGPGRTVPSWGLLWRMELSRLLFKGGSLGWGTEVLSLVQKPGDRTLVGLSPAFWIQTQF
jgi:hypothetical protein